MLQNCDGTLRNCGGMSSTVLVWLEVAIAIVIVILILIVILLRLIIVIAIVGVVMQE